MLNFWTIFKKEVYRVISDRRLVLMIFIMPGLSIYLMYTIMGTVISNQAEQVQQHRVIMYEENMPDRVFEMLMRTDDNGRALFNVEIKPLSELENQDYTTKILDGDIDVIVIFDENFEYSIQNPDLYAAPNVEIIYNGGRQHSAMGYNQIGLILSEYREEVLQSRLDDPELYTVFNTAIEQKIDDRQVAGQGFAMLMPMLIVIFLFAGAMSIGPDSIAGEKERGTIATLLITPIKRNEIATGKVVSLATLSLASALSSFVGIILSLPRLMQMDDGDLGLREIYGVSDYLSILVVLMTTVLFIVGLISIISAYAKTIKEASMLIMPFYFVTLILGLVTSFGSEPIQEAWVHVIPLYGSVNLLAGIFTFNWSIINLILVATSSLVYTLVFVFVLGKMFNSEKVMFQK